MFLNLLKTEDHQKMFLELASVVSMSNPDEISKMLDKSDDNENGSPVVTAVAIGSFWGGMFGNKRTLLSEVIDPKEKQMLEMFAREMGMEVINTISDIDNEFSNYLDIVSRKVIEEQKNNPDLKKEILAGFIDRNIDLGDIDQESIDAELMKHPKLIEEILKSLTLEIISGCETEISSECRKAIVFELIGIAKVDGSYSEQEQMVISEVCRTFSLDNDLIEEMLDLVTQLSAVSNQAIEIILE